MNITLLEFHHSEKYCFSQFHISHFHVLRGTFTFYSLEFSWKCRIFAIKISKTEGYNIIMY